MSRKNLNPVDPARPKRVAIVLSNPGISTTTGWPVGFWWAELSHPYFFCTEAGYEVEVFSPASEIDLNRFDAIVVAGGQGPMFTFEKAVDLHRKFTEFYEAGKIAAALCHGVGILRYARLSNGEPLVKGKTVTGFANVEEDYADQAVWDSGALARDKHVMPWRIEDEIRKLGGNYVQAGLWKGVAIRDGNLITGQQNFSGGETAQLLIETLGR